MANAHPKAKPFSKQKVPVTLTGAEWFALAADLLSMPVSDENRKALKTAKKRLVAQIIKHAKS